MTINAVQAPAPDGSSCADRARTEAVNRGSGSTLCESDTARAETNIVPTPANVVPAPLLTDSAPVPTPVASTNGVMSGLVTLINQTTRVVSQASHADINIGNLMALPKTGVSRLLRSDNGRLTLPIFGMLLIIVGMIVRHRAELVG